MQLISNYLLLLLLFYLNILNKFSGSRKGNKKVVIAHDRKNQNLRGYSVVPMVSMTNFGRNGFKNSAYLFFF